LSQKERQLNFLKRHAGQRELFVNTADQKECLKKLIEWEFIAFKDCRKEFSIQTGTVFEAITFPFKKWLYVIYLLQTARKGVFTAFKKIGITQKTAPQAKKSFWN